MITKEELIQLLHHPDTDRRHSALQLLSSVGEEWVYEHIMVMLGDPDWRIRKATIEILVHHHTPEIIKKIIPGLRDDDNAGRRNAALDALIQIGPAAVEHLRLLIEDQDQDVRKFVVDILGEIGGRQTVPVLISFLEDEDENVRTAAVEYLGKSHDYRAIGPLLNLLKGDNFWLTYAIIIALGEIRNPRTIPALINMLDDEALTISVLMALGSIPTTGAVIALFPFISHTKENIGRVALKSLVSIGENAHKAFFLDAEQRCLVPELFKNNKTDELVEILTGYLDVNDFVLKRVAIVALGWMHAYEARDKLLVCLRDNRLVSETSEAFKAMGDHVIPFLIDNIEDEDERIRVAIVTIIGSFRALAAEKSLIRRLSDEIGHVRAAAALALKELGSEKAIPALIKLLSDDFPDVREAAISALIRINSPKVLAAITPMIDDLESLCKESAVKVFCAITGLDKLDTLLFLMKDANSTIRKTVIQKLGTISGDDVLEPLLLALTDEHPDVRVAAAQALCKYDAENVFQALSRASLDKNIWVSSAAIHALGFLHHDHVVALLIDKLEDKRSIVQITAIQALARQKNERVIEIVKTLFHDNDVDLEVRRTTATILGEFGDPELVPVLLSALSEKDWNFRYSIIKALACFEHPDITEPVLTLATNTRETTLLRLGAIEVFLKNHSDKIVLELINLLQDQDVKVVETAFSVLQTIKGQYEPLIDATKSEPEQQYNWLLDFVGSDG
ncbi:HEAT repeat domain-containing protein [bacterium]|nr:HEAT repeat domain-containing protein [bacterium]